MAIIPRYVVRFRDLRIGDHFKFTNDVAARYASGWYKTAKKVSSRCYVYADRKGVHVPRGRGWHTYKMRGGILKTCVGSVNVEVEPTGRRSPLKWRKGRARGKRVFAGR